MQRTPFFGTATIAAGPTAVQLVVPPTGAGNNPVRPVSKIQIQATPGNTAAVVIGTKSGQLWSLSVTGYPLTIEPSDNDFLNLYDYFVNGTAADKVNFIAYDCLR